MNNTEKTFKIYSGTLAVISLLTVCSAQSAYAQSYQHPYLPTSIWNTPIGSSANYTPINLPVPPLTSSDYENLLTTTLADPIVNVYQGGDTGTFYLGSLYFPYNATFFARLDSNYIVSVLQPDGHTAAQFQPLLRSNAGTDLFNTNRAADDDVLYFNGRDTNGQTAGAHSGSGLPALGGLVRIGETTGGIHHALALEIDGSQLNYNGSSFTPGYRWPAFKADGAASSFYAGTNPGLVIGSLLALPKGVSIASLNLETPEATNVAAALQNYGGYIVDTSTYNDDVIAIEGPEADHLINTYGGSQVWNYNSAWHRDMVKVFTRLALINNNDPNHIGGSPSGDGNATPIDRRITLKSAANGQYVTIANGVLSATSGSATAAQQFDVAEGYQAKFGLQVVGTGQWVAANGGVIPPVVSVRSDTFNPSAYATANSSERFSLIDNGDGTVSISWLNTGNNATNYVALDSNSNAYFDGNQGNEARFNFQDLGPAGVAVSTVPAQTDQLSISTISASAPVGGAIAASVNYTALGNRWIQVLLFGPNWGYLNVSNTHVGAGSGSQDVSVNVPAGTSLGTAHVVINLLSDDFGTYYAQASSSVQVITDQISLASLASSAPLGGAVTAQVNYSAGGNRWIHVVLFDGAYNYQGVANYYVTAGSGVQNVSIGVPTVSAIGTGHVQISLLSNDFSQNYQEIDSTVTLTSH
jgi:hypothetical protein